MSPRLSRVENAEEDEDEDDLRAASETPTVASQRSLKSTGTGIGHAGQKSRAMSKTRTAASTKSSELRDLEKASDNKKGRAKSES
jgi:hypothetical protein